MIKNFICSATLLLSTYATASNGPIHISGQHPHPISGEVKGYDMVFYQFDAKKGQTLVVDFKTDNLSSYFNLYQPDSYPDNGAFFIGSSQGNHMAQTLEKSGQYTLQVYLMRNAARRNEAAKFSFEIQLTDDAEK
ncbi:DNA breaking-rejoining protein [Motilimonas pumila]|uniref:DNA breaking-rejoining protein n=1 Tax=Motilimonas pumila TaxID=2303987 RepID=A0A418Y9S8_9GAMM|nr:DNA breaking-rejoining protein [Motilimonas pumila]RJG38275.1 DNA breaking-rejoining protein [Motilimonas pumila]